MLLVLAAVVGVPVSAVAWGFLALVSKLQGWISPACRTGSASTPNRCGGRSRAPGARRPSGRAHDPVPARNGRAFAADGFDARAGAPTPVQLPGIILAALATLSLGAVLGPEAPLIAIGGGLGAWAVRLAKRDAPAQTSAVMAGHGSFAAISALLGTRCSVPSC